MIGSLLTSRTLGWMVSVASRTVAVAGLALAMAIPATSAMAQPGRMMEMMGGGMMGRGGGGEATYSSRDLDKAAQIVGFDEAQREGARAFFEGYQEKFLAESQAFREKMEKIRDEARETGDWSIMQNLREPAEKFEAERKLIDKQLMDDLKALCTEEQAAKWPVFERTIRRERGLGRGSFMSGESVNLFEVVEKLELNNETKAAVQQTLGQYDLELDRELQNRERVQQELQKDAQGMFGNMRGFQDLQNLDMNKINELVNKGREASGRVRDINRRFAKVIEGQLTGDAKTAFSTEVQKRSYPEVFRQQRTQRSLDAAIGFGDLTSDQRTAIEALRGSYNRELDAINVEHMAAVDKSEAEFSAERMMNWGGDPNDPMRAIRTKKRELNNKMDESLKAILTPEQAQRLPQGGDEEPGRRMRAPGGDNPGGGEAPRRRPRGGGGGGGGGE